jgi:hypothetical protein
MVFSQGSYNIKYLEDIYGRHAPTMSLRDTIKDLHSILSRLVFYYNIVTC